jgi:hypothetical protein
VLGSGFWTSPAVRPSRESWPHLRLPEPCLAAGVPPRGGAPPCGGARSCDRTGLASRPGHWHPRGCRARPRGVRGTYRGSGAESSVGTGSTQPASPFGGVPVFLRAPRARDRRPGPRLSQSRLDTIAFPRPHVSDSRLAPPSGRPEDRRRGELSPATALPSWALVLYSASSAADPVTGSPAALPQQNHPSRGAQPRHLPPSAFRSCTLARAHSTPSTVYSPPRLPSRLAATRNAPEVPPSGPTPPRGAGPSLEAPALLPLVSPASPLSAAHETRASELCSPRESAPERAETPPWPMPS